MTYLDYLEQSTIFKIKHNQINCIEKKKIKNGMLYKTLDNYKQTNTYDYKIVTRSLYMTRQIDR